MTNTSDDAGISNYDLARERLADVFRVAWGRADERRRENPEQYRPGDRTAAGIDAVLGALALAVEQSSPIAWRQEYIRIIEAVGDPR